jgi:hypothetical protein
MIGCGPSSLNITSCEFATPARPTFGRLKWAAWVLIV